MKTPEEAGRRARHRVWDPLLRFLHWSLLISVVAGWFTRHSPGRIHEWVGYAALAVVVVRVLWGFAGPHYARFAQFVRSPVATSAYLSAVISGSAPRYVGHNPLGGWMTVVLLTVVGLVCVSGWLYTTDRFWGIAWVGNTHLWLTYLLIGLVALHLLGVAWSSFKNRENLVAAMFHGRKATPRVGDVD
jgi:cytochrome b